MYFRGIKRRYQTAQEYREAIEKATIIIHGTESEATRAKWIRKRKRLEKEFFVLLYENNNGTL